MPRSLRSLRALRVSGPCALALLLAGIAALSPARSVHAQAVYRCTIAGTEASPSPTPCPDGQRRAWPPRDAAVDTAPAPLDPAASPACRAAREQRAQTAMRVGLHDNSDALRALDLAVQRHCTG